MKGDITGRLRKCTKRDQRHFFGGWKMVRGPTHLAQPPPKKIVGCLRPCWVERFFSRSHWRWVLVLNPNVNSDDFWQDLNSEFARIFGKVVGVKWRCVPTEPRFCYPCQTFAENFACPLSPRLSFFPGSRKSQFAAMRDEPQCKVCNVMFVCESHTRLRNCAYAFTLGRCLRLKSALFPFRLTFASFVRQHNIHK